MTTKNVERPGALIWITGLSGVGKTRFATELSAVFQSRGHSTVAVDGDVVRSIFGNAERYDRAARIETAYQYARLCHFLVAQGLTVICSTISLFHEIQAWNRTHTSPYYEIWVKRDWAQLLKEDGKQLYAKALSGELENVVGVDIPPEYPEYPALVIDNATPSELPCIAGAVVDWYEETLVTPTRGQPA